MVRLERLEQGWNTKMRLQAPFKYRKAVTLMFQLFQLFQPFSNMLKGAGIYGGNLMQQVGTVGTCGNATTVEVY